MSTPFFTRTGSAAMLAFCLLAGAQASFRGNNHKEAQLSKQLGLSTEKEKASDGPPDVHNHASKPMQLSSEGDKHGHYGCAEACNHDSACVSHCETAYYKCNKGQEKGVDAACQDQVLKKYAEEGKKSKKHEKALEGHHEEEGHSDEHHGEGHAEEHHGEGGHAEEHHGEGEGAEEHHGEGESVGEEELERRFGATWAISFFATVSLLAVVFAMVNQKSNPPVRNYTWFLIDQVTAIFLAVLYFQAFDSLVSFHSMGMHGDVACSILHAVAMLAMALILAYFLRGHQLGLAVLCSAGAHVVSFSSIHAAAGLQTHWMDLNYSHTTCVLGLLVLGFGLAIIGYLVYKAKGKMTENDEWMDKTDDLENDFGAMSFSVVFTMFMRFLLTGHHPEDDETELDHTQTERNHMLIYAIACLIVAAFLVNICSNYAAQPNTSYATKRIMTFFKTVAAMNVAWAFLYWGEWEFFGALFPGEEIKGRVMFSIAATVVGALGLIGLTMRTAPEGGSRSFKSEQMVALTAISLVIAWSWELCFDAALEMMTEGVSHPHRMKIVSAVTLFLIVIPVYALYVKEKSGPAAEAIGA